MSLSKPRSLSELALPYAQLMRLDRPTGFYYFYWPCVLGVVQGAIRRKTFTHPVQTVGTAAALVLYNVVLRGYACTWNDLIDADYDRQVARCRNRPIARRAVSPGQAVGFIAAQFAVATGIMQYLPAQSRKYALINLFWYGVYPFMKRLSNWPQAWLGLTFAWNVFVGAAATTDSDAPLIRFNADNSSILVGSGLATLYAANAVWPLIYDTIYAHQDIEDDRKAGVKSLAIAMGKRAKFWFSILAVGQAGLLAANGLAIGAGPWYYAIAVGGTFSSLTVMIQSVNLDSPADCGWWFKTGHWFAGGSMLGGLLIEYINSGNMMT